jgi:hypothetical protein
MVNKKLKNLLKKLFENKEFEMSLIDEESSWDEDERDYVTEDTIYDFKFHVVVRSVLGEGSGAVGDMDIIIDDITKDGESVYLGWVEIGYSENVWYMEELKIKFYYEYLENVPFSVYTNFYGHDEKRDDDTIQESVIKRVIKEILKYGK